MTANKFMTFVAAGAFAVSANFASAQLAPVVPANGVDIATLAASCSSNPSGCAAALQTALATIAVLPLPQAQIDTLVGQVGTIAVSTASSSPSVAADMAQVITTASSTTSNPTVSNNLSNIANQVAAGNASDVDTNAIGGSPT